MNNKVQYDNGIDWPFPDSSIVRYYAKRFPGFNIRMCVMSANARADYEMLKAMQPEQTAAPFIPFTFA